MPIDEVTPDNPDAIDRGPLDVTSSSINPTLMIVPPLVIQIAGFSGPQPAASFQFATDELGVKLTFQLFHTPILGNLAPAPIAGATMVMHLRPVTGTDLVMDSAPTIGYAPFAIGEMVFQEDDMALLTEPGSYTGMAHVTFSDGQQRDFGGLPVVVTIPNP